MTRGAFHRQGPFVESGGLSSPVPRPPRRLSANHEGRRATLSRHPGSSPILHRLLGAVRITTIVSHDALADVSPPTLAPARPPFTLTATLLGALRASLFEARMLLFDFCNCNYDVRANHRSSRFLAGTMASTTFLFSTHHARPLLRER
jgi:hypothetical protein